MQDSIWFEPLMLYIENGLIIKAKDAKPNQAVDFPGRCVTYHLNLGVLGQVARPLNDGVRDTAMTGQRRCSVISEESRRQPPKPCEINIIIVPLGNGHLYRCKSIEL